MIEAPFNVLLALADSLRVWSWLLMSLPQGCALLVGVREQHASQHTQLSVQLNGRCLLSCFGHPVAKAMS